MFYLLTLPFRLFFCLLFGLMFLPFTILFLPFMLLRLVLKAALALLRAAVRDRDRGSSAWRSRWSPWRSPLLIPLAPFIVDRRLRVAAHAKLSGCHRNPRLMIRCSTVS